MGHSCLYARQNTGLLWHTAVRPSVHASYDNISHLFPLLLIGHVVTYIVLIKGGASERCDFSQFGKRQFSYGIYNWLVKKMQHINYCYHAEKLTFNCHKGDGVWGILFNSDGVCLFNSYSKSNTLLLIEHWSSPFFSWIHVAGSLVLCVDFCISLFGSIWCKSL